MTNVVEMPRREAWVATLLWPLPESVRLTVGEDGGRAMVRGMVQQGRHWIVDCDPARDVTYDEGTLRARFEVTDAFATDFQRDTLRVTSVLEGLMPGAQISVQRDVWIRSAPTPEINHERWHPRCVALLDVLADSEHPEADAERYAVLEMLRDVVRKVV